MYTYKELLEDLKTCREIEFVYKKKQHSFTNYPEDKSSKWQFCIDEDRISIYEDINELIDALDRGEIKTDGKTIKKIFEDYDYSDLYIL